MISFARGLCIACVVTALVSGIPCFGLAVAGGRDSTTCSAPEYRQFDFWIGDWDVFDSAHPETVVAHAKVRPILDNCVLLEDQQENDEPYGQSFSIYGASRKVWHQSWMSNRDAVFGIEGRLQNGEMVLSGEDVTADGKRRRVRGTWKPEDNGVREIAIRSTDGGRSWTPWFDLTFRLTPDSVSHSNPSPDDKATVAALDEEYQSAVKRDDVQTMNRILADDFVLVTGSGKIYSKEDLLKESRSGVYVYEHQEDTERNVRIWGDTAVVTAKLWEKGTNDGRVFDYTVWFSDVYVRTPQGWRYVFGQSSLPLPKAPQQSSN